MASYIITTGPKGKGKSIPNYFFALAEELARRNHRVCIILHPKRSGLEDRNGNPAIFSWPSKQPTKWRDARFLLKLIREVSPDCIIGNFSAENVALLAGWLAAVPHRIAWYHTLSSQIKADSRNPAWKDFVLRLRKRMVYRFATHIIGNSEAASRDAQMTYGLLSKKCSVLPYLIPDPIPFAEDGVQREQFKVVCVGRLHPSKGQATLIQALPTLKESFPNVVVEFIGDGPSRGQYEDLASSHSVSDCCRFRGSLALPDVLQAMRTASVCVAPSHNEALGLVNIEAQAVGTPVVASAVDGIKEVVLDNETGFLVSPGRPDELACKIATLLSDRDLREKFGARARSHFMNQFESYSNVWRHAAWLEALVAEQCN